MFALLFCLLLAFSASVADKLVNTTQTPSEVVTDNKQISTTYTPSGDETLAKTLQKIQSTLNDIENPKGGRPSADMGLGAVVAQQITELSSVKSELVRLQATGVRLQAKLIATKTRLETTELELKGRPGQSSLHNSGSTFIRWGRKSCPGNTTLVYAGVAGGKRYTHTGSGNNRLCLTKEPQFDNVPKPSYYGLIYGAEYEYIPGHHDHDVPCSVCRAPQSTTIMVPATLTCPTGWTPQYTGHLSAEREYKTHYASEFVCLDGEPEDDDSGVKNDDGLLFYYVVTQCGSLPCPPFANDRVVTCVVCSK